MVRRNNKAIAQKGLEKQLEWIRGVARKSRMCKPLFSSIQRKWDEAKVTRARKASLSAKRPKPNPWEFCTSSARIVIVPSESEPAFVKDLVFPLVPVPTSSADNLHGALYTHPNVEQVLNAFTEIQANSELAAQLDMVDGALGNDQLHFFVSTVQLPERVMCEHPLCGNHNDHHIAVSFFLLFGLNLMCKTYATAIHRQQCLATAAGRRYCC